MPFCIFMKTKFTVFIWFLAVSSQPCPKLENILTCPFATACKCKIKIKNVTNVAVNAIFNHSCIGQNRCLIKRKKYLKLEKTSSSKQLCYLASKLII